jgi:farnesyl diphosphate synthase
VSESILDSFNIRLADTAAAVETEIDRLTSSTVLPGEIVRPQRLVDAVRHGALGGGKRLRPFLIVETARLFGATGPGVLRAAAAFEMLHCYSLVHDDLPAMDDDDMRRGRPTVHRAFDEATAILAGDALLTLAFDTLADLATDPDPAVRAALVLELARAAGIGGMAGGQMLDLEAEGREAKGREAEGRNGSLSRPLALDEPAIRRLQAMKTGALIRASVVAGAILGRADEATRDQLGRFGALIGLAFQVADDILDVEATAEAAGKATGKDAAKGKATLVALYGVDVMRARLEEIVKEASALLAPHGERGAVLAAAAQFIAFRGH